MIGMDYRMSYSEQREREGEAPGALLLEGATQAPIKAAEDYHGISTTRTSLLQ